MPSWRKLEGSAPGAGDATRPGDIVILDFAREGRHLIFDGVITTVYRNAILTKVAGVSRYAMKLVEDKKFKADAESGKPLAAVASGRHNNIPFAREDGGRLGAHAEASIRMLVAYAFAKGRLPSRARHAPPPPLPPVTLAI